LERRSASTNMLRGPGVDRWTPLRYAPSCPPIHTDYYDFDPVNTIPEKEICTLRIVLLVS
jgi:hypothetical protein